jgi:hypothetical protein
MRGPHAQPWIASEPSLELSGSSDRGRGTLPIAICSSARRSESGEAMIRSLLARLAIVATTLVTSSAAFAEDLPAPGTASATYDTVDAVEVRGSFIVVTGIISGQATPTRLQYSIQDQSAQTGEAAARCDRLALLAMSKPGKFRFATILLDNGFRFSCKLNVRTP